MKKIFVTVEEFIANGGELIYDRDIFARKHAEAPIYKIGVFETSHEIHSGMINIRQTNKSIMLYKNQCWVEIECTPIYA